LDYLSSQEVTNYLQAATEGFKARQYGLQALDEQTQLNEITQYQNAAFTDQTRQPQYYDNSQANAALIQGGFDAALKGIAAFSGTPNTVNADGSIASTVVKTP
jgi:hypothetical protein